MGLFDSIGNAASQVGGFFKGAGETLWETGKGLVDLGVGLGKTAYDLSPAGLATDAYEGLTGNDAPDWLPSAQRGNERVQNAVDIATTIAKDPMLLVDAVIDPIKQDWNNGNYGEAIGRGVTEVLLTVVGTKGADKAGKVARVANAADDAADVARVANRADDVADAARTAGRVGDAAPLSRTLIDDIKAIPKGERPAPSTYLSETYISDHLAQFENGATRFQVKSGLDKYGPGQVDGTSFVMPKAEADRLLAEAAGDPRALERALGLPEGQLDGNTLMRVDFDKPAELDLRMPSGNEAGANEHWIPGGRLPNGNSEAVIDVGGLPSSRYTATPVEP